MAAAQLPKEAFAFAALVGAVGFVSVWYKKPPVLAREKTGYVPTWVKHASNDEDAPAKLRTIKRRSSSTTEDPAGFRHTAHLQAQPATTQAKPTINARGSHEW